MTSPATIPPRPRRVARSPALAASPPLGTACTSTPCDLTPSCLPTLGSAAVTFRLGSRTLPNSMSCGTTLCTRSTGIANPTPALAPVLVKMAVLTPTSLPLASSSGPPEFPGLIAASVWIPPLIKLPAWLWIVRPRPDTTPVVRVWSNPNGLPMANTAWPTLTPSDLPRAMGAMYSFGALTLRTARSLLRSAPTRVAGNVLVLPSAPSRVTFATSPGSRPLGTCERMLPMTCQLVTTCPSESHTNPVPLPSGTTAPEVIALPESTVTSTTLTTERVQRSNSATVPDSSDVSASAGAIGGVTSARVGTPPATEGRADDAETRAAIPSASASRRDGGRHGR
mmetsp:Transcript_5346/g.24692  ORF Transcript_5346/g.24692 Transcript_5346/m.24692 type:complete len:339 (+) Transcript_5346:1598-2614(+)